MRKIYILWIMSIGLFAACSNDNDTFFRDLGADPAAGFGNSGRRGWEGAKLPRDPKRQVALCRVSPHPRGSRQPRDRNSPCGFPRLVMNEPMAPMEASKAP